MPHSYGNRITNQIMRTSLASPRQRRHNPTSSRENHFHAGPTARRKGAYNPWGIQTYLLVVVLVLLIHELSIQIFVALFKSPIILDEHANLESLANHKRPRLAENEISIEIFSAPKPFVGEDKEVTLRAIKSWQSLVPRPNITLLGYETGYDIIAAEYGLSVRADIDRTFLGVPLFNSMFAIANQSKATISVLINGDIILLQDFVNTMRTVVNRFQDFLVISARYDLPNIPAHLEENDPNFYTKLGEYAQKEGTLHTYGGMDLWAWNSNGPPLFDPVMPHFIFGRGKYDNWLTHETIAAGRRAVIDASEAILSVHVQHGYHRVQNDADSDEKQETETERRIGRRRLLQLFSSSSNEQTPRQHEKKRFWSENKKSKFELFINIYLSLSVGTYKNQLGTINSAPWRLASCIEERGNCFLPRERPGVCNCEYSPTNMKTQTDEEVVNGSRIVRCGTVSKEELSDYKIPVDPPNENGNGKKYRTFGLPLTLESLAKQVAVERTLIVTALNYDYREMMMNWVCNMRQLRITNFVIAALDEDLYRYAFVRGLPVYLDRVALLGSDGSFKDVKYRSEEFNELTKAKSRVALELLTMEYDVLWTDVDVLWFRNPLVHLKSQKVDIVVQSDAPDNKASNREGLINSGFYFARANEHTAQVFQEIVMCGSRSKDSEQTCFYEVLCGAEGDQRVGADSCLFQSTTTVKFLDRTLYPNGATQGIWDVTAGTIKLAFSHAYVVHNNWVDSLGKKWERLKRHDLVFYDLNNGLCIYEQEV